MPGLGPTIRLILTLVVAWGSSSPPTLGAVDLQRAGKSPIPHRVGATFGQQGPDVKPIIVDYLRIPETLSEAVERAEVVAHVRLSEPRYLRLYRGSSSRVTTEYDAEVLEYFKYEGVGGPAELHLSRVGGLVVENGRRVRYVTPNFSPFRGGEEYVLFLTWHESRGAYTVSSGPHGSFRLDAERGVVVTEAPSGFARARSGRSIPGFFAELRREAGDGTHGLTKGASP